MLKFGAMVIGALAILSGIGGLLVGALAAIAGTALDVTAQSALAEWQIAGGYALVIAGLSVMIFGVLQIVFGVGIWRLRGWAWVIGVVIHSLALVTAILGLFTGAVIPASLVTIVISGGILFYLLEPRVRKMYGRA